VHDVNVQKDSLLNHLERRCKTRPNFDIVVTYFVTLSWVEEVSSDLLELDSLKKGVEKHFVEH
jgi:hypothetical protein